MDIYSLVHSERLPQARKVAVCKSIIDAAGNVDGEYARKIISDNGPLTSVIALFPYLAADKDSAFMEETLDAIISVPLCYLAFKYHGFAGLGIAYIIWYLLYAMLTGTVFYFRYGLRLNRHVTRTSILATICCLTAITVKETLSPLLSTCVMLAIAACFIPPLRRLMRR